MYLVQQVLFGSNTIIKPIAGQRHGRRHTDNDVVISRRNSQRSLWANKISSIKSDDLGDDLQEQHHEANESRFLGQLKTS